MAAPKESRLAAGTRSTRGATSAADESDAHQRRHGQIGAAPAHELGDVERARAGADQRQAIAELQAAAIMPWRSVEVASMRQPSMTTSCVADAKATRSADAMVRPRLVAGSLSAIPTSPTAVASCASTIQPRRRPRRRASNGHVVAIDDGRPQEFQRVGERHPAQHADLGARDSGLSKPGREGAEHEKERQSGGKAQRQHQGDAAIREKIAQTETASGFCHGSPFGSGRRAHGSHANAANWMSIVVPKRCGEVKDIARAAADRWQSAFKPVQRRLRRSAPRCGAQVPERPKDARETPARRRCSA